MQHAEALRRAVRDQDWERAEKIFAMIADNGAERAWDDLLKTVEDGADVHRIVLAHRSWDTLDLIGMEHAETMLRQSLRYCLKQEKWAGKHGGELRAVLPKLLDQHRLLDREPGNRRGGGSVGGKSQQDGFRIDAGTGGRCGGVFAGRGVCA